MAPFAHALRPRPFRALVVVVLSTLLALVGLSVGVAPAGATQPPTPWLTGVAPNHGPAAGGNEVVLTGSNFEYFGVYGSSNVQFGSTYAQVISHTATAITVRAPAGLAGTTVDIRLDSGSYYEAPTTQTFDDYVYEGRTRRPLTMSPTHGSPLGGTQVTITGDGVAFKNARSVTIGGAAAPIVSSTATSVTVTTPAGTPGGKAPVVVTTAAGDLEGTQWSRFVYDWTTAPPQVTEVSPSSVAVDATVTVRGSDFTGATGVTVGGDPVYFYVSSNEELHFSAPARLPGTADVIVETPVGVSANTPADDLEILGDATTPAVSQVSPNHGTSAGGTRLTIRGRNLGAATAVRFDHIYRGVDLQVISGDEIQVTTPYMPSYHDKVDVTVVTPVRESFADGPLDDFTFDVVLGSAVVAPNHGPASAATSVLLTEAGGLDFNRVWKVLLTRPGAADVELQMSAPARGQRNVTIPAGIAGQTARIELYSYEDTRLNGNDDTFTWDAPAGSFAYETKGSVTLKTLTRGTFAVTGGAQLAVTPAGAVTGTLQFNQASARLSGFGFLPVTVKIGIVPSGATTGSLTAGVLKTTTKVRIKVLEAKIFGAIPLAGGNNCQTKQLTDLPLASGAGFDPAKGGRLTGTFRMSDLNGCGALNELVSPVTAGGGNTLSLDLAPRG